jgi:hypothetical protein
VYNKLLKHSKVIFLLFIVFVQSLQVVKAQMLPLEQKNTINQDWLVQDKETAQLIPFAEQRNARAIHQWVYIDQSQPFQISFAAPEDLSLFLNNRLVFSAKSAGAYNVNLTDYAKKVKPVKGRYLLTVWHPERQPNLKSFNNIQGKSLIERNENKDPIIIRVREYISKNVFIFILLAIGLIYGYIRTNYPSDFESVFGPNSFFRSSSLQEGLLAKPVGSWASILFILAFSLSLALLVVAIHTNMHQVRFFNQLIPVSGADLTTKVIFYTILIFVVILLKYLFVKVLGFIFGLDQVVDLQYREFVRSLLFLGIFLPVVMLLYLVYHESAPGVILTISNIAISLLLIITTFRVLITVNTKATILNLHLFSYLCATEVIPLAIMLKLIVLNF